MLLQLAILRKQMIGQDLTSPHFLERLIFNLQCFSINQLQIKNDDSHILGKLFTFFL